MNQGLIRGKIIDYGGRARSSMAVALNHVGRFWSPIRTQVSTAYVVTDSNGLFQLPFGWEPTDLGHVVEGLMDGDSLPYQLNIFEQGEYSLTLATRIVGERDRADASHIYNNSAFVHMMVSLGNISQGAGPPPPYDRFVDAVNYWGEFRKLPLPAVLQQGGFMRPSPEFYALLGYIVVRI